MTELVLASNNRKKIAELETFLAGGASNRITVKTLSEIGFTEEIEEDGDSFEENSLIKAMTPAGLGKIGIADDSGLAVDALGGAPGIYSARYSGEGGDEANRKKLLSDMKDVPQEKRTARFVCVMTLVLPEHSELVIPPEWRADEELCAKRGISPERVMCVRGECEGRILNEEHGTGGFGYDPLFYSPRLGCTFAEAGQESKNAVSHRGAAMAAFIPRLLRVMQK